MSNEISFSYTSIKNVFFSDAVPTIFNVPAHLQIEKKQRKPPKVRTAAATVAFPSMLTDNDATEVTVILDACHMLKLMRNALADKHVLLDGQGRPIKWEYI